MSVRIVNRRTNLDDREMRIHRLNLFDGMAGDYVVVDEFDRDTGAPHMRPTVTDSRIRRYVFVQTSRFLCVQMD